jgi:phage portal protein BeeE
MEKLLAILAVFRQGNAVADPVVWKNRGMLIAALVAVLAAAERVAAAFGYPLGVTDSDNAAIAAGVAAVYHLVLTATTSDKVGLPPVGGDGDAGVDQSGRDGEPAPRIEP